MLVSQIWPVGIARLGSGVYFFFMAVNLAFVPVSGAPSDRGSRFWKRLTCWA